MFVPVDDPDPEGTPSVVLAVSASASSISERPNAVSAVVVNVSEAVA